MCVSSNTNEIVAAAHAEVAHKRKWDLVVKNQKLIQWTLSKFCKGLEPLSRDELEIVLQQTLETVAEKWQEDRGVSFSHYYNRCAIRDVKLFLRRETRKRNHINAIASTIDDSYYDQPNSEQEQADNLQAVNKAIDTAAEQLGFTDERKRLLVSYYRGEKSMVEIGEQLGVSRGRVQQLAVELRDTVRELLAI